MNHARLSGDKLPKIYSELFNAKLKQYRCRDFVVKLVAEQMVADNFEGWTAASYVLESQKAEWAEIEARENMESNSAGTPETGNSVIEII